MSMGALEPPSGEMEAMGRRHPILLAGVGPDRAGESCQRLTAPWWMAAVVSWTRELMPSFW
jgi:hypothetical protein